MGVGNAVSFAIRYHHFQRKGYPYGDCQEEEESEDYYYPGGYTKEGCFRSCFQESLIEECGCGDSRFPKPEGTEYCSGFDHAQESCRQNYLRSKGDYTIFTSDDCDCRERCHQGMYSATATKARWPIGKDFWGFACNQATLNRTGISCLDFYMKMRP